MKGRDKQFLYSIIRERADILLSLADKEYAKSPELAKRYMKLVKKLYQRHTMYLGDLRKRFCQRCFTPWIKGKTVIVSANAKNENLLIYECKVCGYKRSFPKDGHKHEKIKKGERR